jgi:hypothetical protein
VTFASVFPAPGDKTHEVAVVVEHHTPSNTTMGHYFLFPRTSAELAAELCRAVDAAVRALPASPDSAESAANPFAAEGVLPLPVPGALAPLQVRT